ncbi:hypothetical protein DM01DRAFT_1079574 [Hesseltinella vesiculosa]|uniref:Uncharacterized protein n=1 Tax=Hesseltinella vesiculosa TaxID=101127 RepID=A0A1X2GDM8_9FUNG|nr:hypothetical protein DM01DRAFT_1079574 [Hesseltinella vesiculosa]
MSKIIAKTCGGKKTKKSTCQSTTSTLYDYQELTFGRQPLQQGPSPGELASAVMTGADYGVVTSATTMAFTLPDLEHIMAGDYVKLPKPSKMTAKDIQWQSGQLQFTKKLSKSMKAHPNVVAAEKLMSKEPVSTTSTPSAVLERYTRIRDTTTEIQSFYSTKWIWCRRRFLAWRAKSIKKAIVAKERQNFTNNNKVPLIRFIGNAGLDWELARASKGTPELAVCGIDEPAGRMGLQC